MAANTAPAAWALDVVTRIQASSSTSFLKRRSLASAETRNDSAAGPPMPTLDRSASSKTAKTTSTPPASPTAQPNGHTTRSSRPAKHVAKHVSLPASRSDYASLRTSVSSPDTGTKPKRIETAIPSGSFFDDDPFWTSKIYFSNRGSLLMPDSDKTDLVAEGAKLAPSEPARAAPPPRVLQEVLRVGSSPKQERSVPLVQPTHEPAVYRSPHSEDRVRPATSPRSEVAAAPSASNRDIGVVTSQPALGTAAPALHNVQEPAMEDSGLRQEMDATPLDNRLNSPVLSPTFPPTIPVEMDAVESSRTDLPRSRTGSFLHQVSSVQSFPPAVQTQSRSPSATVPSIRVDRPSDRFSKSSSSLYKRKNPEPSMASSFQRQDPGAVEELNKHWSITQLPVPGVAGTTLDAGPMHDQSIPQSIPAHEIGRAVSTPSLYSPSASVTFSSKQGDAGAQAASVSSASPALNPKISMPSAFSSEKQVTGNLSEEERTASQRVRSMYEQGAGAYSYLLKAQSSEVLGKADRFPTSTSAARTKSLTLSSTPRTGANESFDLGLAANRNDWRTRNAQEAAGGIEDWTNVSAGDLDRYGFIQAKKTVIRSPATGNGSATTPVLGAPTSLSALPVVPEGVSTSSTSVTAINGSESPEPIRQKAPMQAKSLDNLGGRTNVALIRKPSRSAFGFFSRRRAPDPTMMLAPLPRATTGVPTEGRAALERRREAKWAKMARPVDTRATKGGGMRFTFDTSDPKLVSRVWKGIPDRWRATAWHSFLTTSARRRQGTAMIADSTLIDVFHELQTRDCADDAQIDLDVPRTIGSHIMFRSRYRGGQRLLFRVLRALALHFAGTGYVQGMAALASTLLCYFDEEMAFVVAVRMWELRGLQALYERGFAGLMAALDDLDRRWLAPTQLGRALRTAGVEPTAYGTRWYLTLFSHAIPFPAQLRVWDAFMLLGDAARGGGADLDVVHATAAALLEGLAGTLLRGDFEQSMMALTGPVPVAREDVLMRVALREWRAKGASGAG